MKTTALPALLERLAGEYLAKKTIFEIPESTWRHVFAQEKESSGLKVMSSSVSIPLGPAAGPHTQIAPNLIAAYLSGARVFELKTVQVNDTLDIEKPCIDALDEGHNVEWSTELTLDQARMEYLNAWLTINLLARMWSHKPGDFMFNMSVGYTLEGIKSEKMDAFIEGMRRPENTAYWEAAIQQLSSFVESDLFGLAFGEEQREKAREIAAHMPVRPVHSVTLSTMHGCPPDEIERIGRYLLEEKGFDTYIKLNPTLLGFDEARSILNRLGWTDIVLKRESFEHDLQFDIAIRLIRSLSETAAARGRRFGIKLSNTLANVNDGCRLPGGERYMSGRALFPLTIHLAAKLAKAVPEFAARFSYCGGVAAYNAADLIKAGLGPLTIATDLLKPGGYQRMAHMVRQVLHALQFAPDTSDPVALDALAEGVFDAPWYRREWKEGTAAIAGPLPLFDCFAAPCIEACPVHQKAPAYIAATGAGDADRGLAIILSDNPLPAITGVLCDHVCQEHCSRVDYEGAVRIRDVKLATVRAARPVDNMQPAYPHVPRGATAVIGAGPAGLACAWHLAHHGQKVVVFDRRPAPGGVPAHIIPSFRIAREDLAADVQRLEKLGVTFRFGVEIRNPDELLRQGFDSLFIASGAARARELPLQGEGIKVVHALDFLEACMQEGMASMQGIRNVLVVGGGNTACDAVRMAVRIPGVVSVRWSYRRTRREMPADLEELSLSLHEAQALAQAQGTEDEVFLELSLPESMDAGTVTLRRMKLGEKDASGRRKPVPTEETFSLPCDLLVTAVGEEPDPEFFKACGIEIGRNGLPVADPKTMEAAPGVYVGGDARRGPSSIIAAEADGRAAARAILARHGIEPADQDYRAPAWSPEARASRGAFLPSLASGDPEFVVREAERCLHCDSACLRCVEVCPNRSNMVLETGRAFDQPAQILHIDRLCNECGNCGFFCPWNGEPYSGKPTLFDSREELAASQNAGFAFCDDEDRPTLVLRSAVAGPVVELPYPAWNGVVSRTGERAMIALARTVWAEHRYLVEVHA
ncbi:MAG: putative selenate reductase subunit YgfK [Spirochaetaceae bacterium]|nr:putative selenate reductase subunit YgfK [Spirochaetaceae bacterium]